MYLREVVIDYIIGYPEIYDMSNENYKNTNRKKEIYKYIALSINEKYPSMFLSDQDVKNLWFELVKTYKEHKVQNSQLRSGSAAPAQKSQQLKDLLDKLSFLDQPTSHRTVRSSLEPMSSIQKRKSSTKQEPVSIWNSEMTVSKAKPITPPENIFCRTKKRRTDTQFNADMSQLFDSVKSCASTMSENIDKKKNASCEPKDSCFKKMFIKFFNDCQNDNSRDKLMLEMLEVINQYKKM